MRFFLIFALLLQTLLLADAGDKRVRLLGLLQDDAPKRLSPRKITQEMQIHSFRIYNPWEKREDLYEGVFLKDFADKYASKETKRVLLRALDDYTVEFERSYWESERILIALKMNGEFIPIREKGPLRIIFVDYDPKIKRYESNLSDWMWMINKIEFK